MSQRLFEILSEHLTSRKREIIERVAANRTRHIALVLEDIYQTHNASAMTRSMESWGIQDIYAIENQHSLHLHRRIARGAFDWLTLHKYDDEGNNSIRCIQDLREKGYVIGATSLNEDAISPDKIDVSKKIAIVMGTELTGISEEMKSNSDFFIKIPMYGFTESLNVSVAAGIIIQQCIEKMRRSNINWQLSAEEQLDLKIQWARNTIHWSQHLVDLYENGEL